MPSQAPAPRVSPGAHPPVPPARASSLPRGKPAPQRTHARSRAGGRLGRDPALRRCRSPPERDIGRAGEPRPGRDTPGPSRERRTWWAGHTPKARSPRQPRRTLGCRSGPRPLRPHRCPRGPGSPRDPRGTVRGLPRPRSRPEGHRCRCSGTVPGQGPPRTPPHRDRPARLLPSAPEARAGSAAGAAAAEAARQPPARPRRGGGKGTGGGQPPSAAAAPPASRHRRDGTRPRGLPGPGPTAARSGTGPAASWEL